MTKPKWNKVPLGFFSALLLLAPVIGQLGYTFVVIKAKKGDKLALIGGFIAGAWSLIVLLLFRSNNPISEIISVSLLIAGMATLPILVVKCIGGYFLMGTILNLFLIVVIWGVVAIQSFAPTGIKSKCYHCTGRTANNIAAALSDYFADPAHDSNQLPTLEELLEVGGLSIDCGSDINHTVKISGHIDDIQIVVILDKKCQYEGMKFVKHIPGKEGDGWQKESFPLN